MRDVQSQKDERNLPINKVGVKNVAFPLEVLDKVNHYQSTLGKVDLFADLPHHFKGTHMSRFIEVFQRYSRRISMKNFLEILKEIRSVLDAEKAFGKIEFPYFIEKEAPVSKQKSMMRYLCAFEGECDSEGSRFFVHIEVPVLTLCPCSKEISARGAHNQRSFCRVKVQAGSGFFWIEDIVRLIESCASSGLYTLLKREDEKYVTELSYDNPVFVEDLVREVTLKIAALKSFPWFSVEAENLESIHLHDAYAYIEYNAQEGDPDVQNASLHVQ